jgi:hypothetical protein
LSSISGTRLVRSIYTAARGKKKAYQAVKNHSPFLLRKRSHSGTGYL